MLNATRALASLASQILDGAWRWLAVIGGVEVIGPAEVAGLADLHPHCLRHSCGYALVDRGVDLRTIQERLGYQSIEMTVRYTRISQRRFNGLWR